MSQYPSRCVKYTTSKVEQHLYKKQATDDMNLKLKAAMKVEGVEIGVDLI